MSNVVDFSEFAGGPPKAFSKVNPADHPDLSDLLQSPLGIIRCKGKVWTLSVRGDTHKIATQIERVDKRGREVKVDGIRFVILRVPPRKAKTWYPDGYDQNNPKKAPECASINGISPNPGVEKPQAKFCDTCPRNSWKPLANGREGKECRDSLRLAVLLLPEHTREIGEGEPLSEPMYMQVPAASMENLNIMFKTMKQKGFPGYYAYVVEATFDDEVPYPKMMFKPRPFEKFLKPGDDEAIVELMQDEQVKRITGEAGGLKMLEAPVEADEFVSLVPPAGFDALPVEAPKQLEPRKNAVAQNGGGDAQPVAPTVSPADDDDPTADPELEALIGKMVKRVNQGNG